MSKILVGLAVGVGFLALKSYFSHKSESPATTEKGTATGKQASAKTQEYFVGILIGAPAISKNSGVARPAAEYSLTGEKYPDPNTWHKDLNALHGVKKDIANVGKHIMEEFNVNVDAHDNVATGQDARMLIEKLFSRNSDQYFIYYSGHGEHGTGDWCFGNDRLSLSDVLGMWDSRVTKRDTQYLIILADCCYSGSWANDHRVLKRVSQEDPTFPHIIIQAACKHNETSLDTPDGGMFTCHFLWSQTSRYPLRNEIFKDPKFSPTSSIQPVTIPGKKSLLIAVPFAMKGIRLLNSWALERNYTGWFK